MAKKLIFLIESNRKKIRDCTPYSPEGGAEIILVLRPGGIPKGGRCVAQRILSNDCRWQSLYEIIGFADSAPLRLLLIDFLAEARKPPPEAPSRNADRASDQE